MNINQLVLAYAVSFFGGWLVAGTVVYFLRRGTDDPRPFVRPIDLWIGGLERAIATTLVIWAPPMLPAFIGGWMALKFAADWQRRPDDLKAARGSLIFLIGSTLSFAVAIGAGLIVSRAAVDIWATPN